MKTMNTRSLRRLSVCVLAVVLCFALAVSVSAAGAGTYSVTIYQDGSTSVSMANACVDGNATVTEVSNGYRVEIPVTTIEMTMGGTTYEGEITTFSVDGATSSGVDDENSCVYFVVASLGNLTFDATMSIYVYAVSGTGSYTHSNVAADIVLTAVA